LAIATSIDALAAGFTLSFFDLAPMYSILMIGITTFFFSVAGVYIGGTAGSYLESKAELLGGMILISIGIKILLEHLGYI